MGSRLKVKLSNTEPQPTEIVYEFDQNRVVIGRGRGSDVCVPDPTVSSMHATLAYDGSRYTLCDEHSTNGTRVQGHLLTPGRAKPLAHGDVLEVGQVELVFECGVSVSEPTSSERTASLARRLLRELLERETTVPLPSLEVTKGPHQGLSLLLDPKKNRWVIGRDEHVELCLEDPDVSREHAEIQKENVGFLLRDLGSHNGLRVSGRYVRERVLQNGDEIQLGQHTLCFSDPAQERVEAIQGEPDRPTQTYSEDYFLPTPDHEPDTMDATADTESHAEHGVNATSNHPSPSAKAKPLSHSAPKSSSIARPALRADVFIYILAGVVFLLSVLGLVFLLSSS